MRNLKLIVEDKAIYCEHKNENVNIRTMKHPFFGTIVSKICDYAIICRETNCEYNGGDDK